MVDPKGADFFARHERFFDTSILIYTFAAADHRSARAEALMAEGG